MNRRLFHHFRHIRARSAPEQRNYSSDILLAGGAVGAWLAWFAIVFTFWFYGAARDRNVNYPDPIRFPVDSRLLAISIIPKTEPTASGAETPAVKSGPDGFSLYWNDWGNGIEEAAREHKPVFVVFMRPKDRWTMDMETQILFTPKTRKSLYEEWVCIRIDLDTPWNGASFGGRPMTYRGLAHYFHADSTPTPSFLFIDKNGSPVQIVSGNMGKELIGSLLDYMKNEIYAKKIPFEEYRRTLSSAGR